MGLGDQIAQNFLESDSKPIDYVRTMQFAGIGFFIAVSNYVKRFLKIISIFQVKSLMDLLNLCNLTQKKIYIYIVGKKIFKSIKWNIMEEYLYIYVDKICRVQRQEHGMEF